MPALTAGVVAHVANQLISNESTGHRGDTLMRGMETQRLFYPALAGLLN